MAFFRQLEACSTGRLFFVRAVKLGRLGWYVMTSGALLLQRVPVRGVRASSLPMCDAWSWTKEGS